MTQFNLEGKEFIELNKLLKILRLVGTGGEANIHILEGEVTVNGETEYQKRKKLRIGDVVRFGREEIAIV